MENTLRGIFRFALMIFFLLLLFPLMVVARILGGPIQTAAKRVMYKVSLMITSIRVVKKGGIANASKQPVMFVSNHSSYLDILVLGSILPHASFIAKQEVAGWAVFGWMAQLVNTVFIRRRKTEAKGGLSMIEKRLYSGESLILFAEGTTSDGSRVLPFKSTLMRTTENWQGKKPLRLQPVSITCTHINNLPAGTKWRKFYSWIGDEDLVPHLWQVLKTQSMTVHVAFHPPVKANPAKNRKMLTRELQQVVEKGVSDAVRGSASSKKLDKARLAVL